MQISQRRLRVKRYYKSNHQITAAELRVIDEEGKQIGILSKEEALKKALQAEMDLVEIAPDAKPPVAKIIDFKKFKYQEERKEKEARKHAKQTELKEVRFSPFIGEHDLNTGLERAKKFLLDGDLVKISIRFTGRQMSHTEFGPRLYARILASLSDYAEPDRDPKFEGRRYIGLVRPKKGLPKKPEETKEEKNETKNQESSS